MFVEASRLGPDYLVEADVAIVGAGAAGITIGRELARRGLQVALLESGGYDFDGATQALYEGDVVGQSFPPLSADRLRFLGGTTNHWDGSCRPFDALDFEARPHVPGSGWPITRAELDPWYEKAHPILQLGPYRYAAADWASPDAKPFALPGDSRVVNGVFQYSPPTRFGTAYRDDLTKAEKLKVYLGANLVEIVLAEGGAVTGLRLASLDGKRGRASARFYVLATGGIENARLLLNSDAVARGGIGNGSDLVGRCFMDHPFVTSAATLVFPAGTVTPFYDLRETKEGQVQGCFLLRPDVLAAEGLPNLCFGIQRASANDRFMARTSLTHLWKSLKSGSIPDHLGFHLGRILEGIEGRTVDTVRRWTGTEPDFFVTNYSCECPPDRESRVLLAPERDALGLRRIKLDWRLPSDLRRHMRRAHEILADELGRAGIARMRLDLPPDDVPIGPVANGHHHMGTTRMHADPKQGVVDAQCRVHGIANLYVAGSSVFPTYSFDDPTLTIVALSLRLADRLGSIIHKEGA